MSMIFSDPSSWRFRLHCSRWPSDEWRPWWRLPAFFGLGLLMKKFNGNDGPRIPWGSVLGEWLDRPTRSRSKEAGVTSADLAVGMRMRFRWEVSSVRGGRCFSRSGGEFVCRISSLEVENVILASKIFVTIPFNSAQMKKRCLIWACTILYL